MIWLKLLPVVLTIALGLTQLGLAHRWRDRRTKKHRYARWAVGLLFLVSGVATGAVVVLAHRGGEELSKKLDEISEQNMALSTQNESLSGQVTRLQEQLDDARSARTTGIIFPANEPRPAHDCGPIPEKALALFFGNGVAWVDAAQDSIPLLSIGDQTIITLVREAGGVYLSAIVLRADGRGVATILGNRFGINPENYFRVTSRDRHELIIVDSAGTEVLRARFLNETSFQLTGVFYVGPKQALVVKSDRILVGGTEFGGKLCLAENKIGKAIFAF